MKKLKFRLVFGLILAVWVSMSGLSVQAAPSPSTSWMRGVNVPSIWYDSQSYTALTTIKNQTFNTVRIVWQTNGSPTRLHQIIDRCAALGLTPIVELHDATGYTDATSLNNCVNYWIRSDVKSILSAHNTIRVNIANEWGAANSTSWRDGYINAVRKLRTNGVWNTLVIDSGGWGQDRWDIQNYARSIMAVDSNVIFDIHMYGSWNNTNDIWNFLSYCYNNNIPLIVGEFGYNYNNGNNNLGCRVDALTVMNACKYYGYGFVAWSWCGNDSANSWLNMTYNWYNYNYWGSLVRNNMW